MTNLMNINIVNITLLLKIAHIAPVILSPMPFDLQFTKKKESSRKLPPYCGFLSPSPNKQTNSNQKFYLFFLPISLSPSLQVHLLNLPSQ